MTTLAEARYAERLPALTAATAARTLESVAAQLRTVGVDYAQHTEGFDLPEPDPALSLSQQLSLSLEQLAITLREEFLGSGNDPIEVITAFSAEHDSTSQS